jgi:hypothetical protein
MSAGVLRLIIDRRANENSMPRVGVRDRIDTSEDAKYS